MNSPQIPLALRFPPEQRLEAFIGAAAGQLALLGALAGGDRSDWIYLSGPAGSGKTHLSIGACAEASAAGRRAIYLPLASVAGRMSDALAMLEGADLVCLDGLETIAGDRAGEVALFDFHNRLRSAGGSALYAARETPLNLGLGLPDLRSRLGQCTQLAISPLDDAGRREVLARRAAARGLTLEEAVLDWLFRRVGRDLVTLTALLDRIDRESLAAQRRVTVPFLRQLLAG